MTQSPIRRLPGPQARRIDIAQCSLLVLLVLIGLAACAPGRNGEAPGCSGPRWTANPRGSVLVSESASPGPPSANPVASAPIAPAPIAPVCPGARP
jgi:hypothetical protein